MNLDVNTRLEDEKLINKKYLQAFNELGIYTINDFLNKDKISYKFWTGSNCVTALREVLSHKYLGTELTNSADLTRIIPFEDSIDQSTVKTILSKLGFFESYNSETDNELKKKAMENFSKPQKGKIIYISDVLRSTALHDPETWKSIQSPNSCINSYELIGFYQGYIAQKKQQNQTTIQEQNVVSPTTIEQQPQPEEITKKETNSDLANLDVQTLIKTINPELIERKMKLPNGVEISAHQYIQEIVYPHLPKNGIVILNNNTLLLTKQFIEEGVMSECQEKYNGDFPRYMAERTKNNVGVISVQNNDEEHYINPVEITDFINPDLLEMKMKLPNGAEISARQYIQEVYAPHIPTNGRVILKNGIEISAKQYIEEILLGEGQSKYNGDISQILYNTTKSNIGIVNSDPQKIQETLLQLRNQATDYTQQSAEVIGGRGK